MKRTRNAAAAFVRRCTAAAGIALALSFFASSVTAATAVPDRRPDITSNPPVAAQVGADLTYRVRATDRDNSGTLIYSLDTAPATMTIDAETGLIEWTPMSGDEGATPVVVRVQDNGAPAQSTTQSFDVFVAAEESDAPSLLYFSTKANTAIPGVPGPYDDADIYRLDPATGAYDKVFDARDAGLPGNADIDALSVVDADTFYMSFARGAGTNVPGLGNVGNSDVVLYNGGVFQHFLDGSDVDLGDKAFAENIDAIDVESASAILLSTAGKPSIGGLPGVNKEDILRCEGSFGATTSCNWSLYFDGSANALRGKDENVDDFYELDNDLYIGTRGPFSVPGVNGKTNDILRCATTQGGAPKTCSSYSRFLEGDFYALPVDVDAMDFASGAVSEPLPDDLFRVVILGSSTARGTGASAWRKAWARLLNTWLKTATAEHEVVNLASGGQTTVDIRPDGSNPPPNHNRNINEALNLEPDIILINLPSNNVAEGIPVDTTIAHYQEIVAEAAQQGVPVFMTTTQPRNFADDAMRMQLLDEAIAIRAEFGADVIDIYDELTDFTTLGLKPAYDSGDGTHLNDAGHNYIFETTRDKIAPLVP